MAGLSSHDAKPAPANCSNNSHWPIAPDPVKTYSGGMKRRINLGCALLHVRKFCCSMNRRWALIRRRGSTSSIHPRPAFIRHGDSLHDALPGGAETLCDRIAIIDTA